MALGDPDPWERQPGESSKAFAAFVEYRDRGPGRATGRVVEAGYSRKSVKVWCTQKQWVSRAQAWDDEQDRLWQAEMHDKRIELARRHGSLALAVQETVVARLKTIQPKELSPKDLISWLDIATRLERATYGEPDRVAVTGRDGGPLQVDVTLLTDEERRARMAEVGQEIIHRVTEGGLIAPTAGPVDDLVDT